MLYTSQLENQDNRYVVLREDFLVPIKVGEYPTYEEAKHVADQDDRYYVVQAADGYGYR